MKAGVFRQKLEYQKTTISHHPSIHHVPFTHSFIHSFIEVLVTPMNSLGSCWVLLLGNASELEQFSLGSSFSQPSCAPQDLSPSKKDLQLRRLTHQLISFIHLFVPSTIHSFILCGSRKYPYPHHGRLFDLHPPPPRIFRSRGVFDDPPSPQEFPEFFYL